MPPRLGAFARLAGRSATLEILHTCYECEGLLYLHLWMKLAQSCRPLLSAAVAFAQNPVASNMVQIFARGPRQKKRDKYCCYIARRCSTMSPDRIFIPRTLFILLAS